MASRAQSTRANASAPILARTLGWLSIGLGLAELVAPRRMSGSIGLEKRSGLFRACGMREIASGIGILASRNPSPWLWSRVAGDAMDLAAMTPALGAGNKKQKAAAGALAAVAAITLLDLYCAYQSSGDASPEARRQLRDYSRRSGFPQPAKEMIGAALRS